MTDRGIQALFYALMLLLPLSALIARRPPLGATLRMALAWLAIFVVGLLIVAGFDRLPSMSMFSDDRRVTGGTTQIPQAEDGHFWASVELNGKRRHMLIDSGATTTALSLDTARAIGVDLERSRFPVLIDTANGTVQARLTTVTSFRLGLIVAHDLPVVVVPRFGVSDVLGMNFLSRLKTWRVQGRTLVLTPHPSS